MTDETLRQKIEILHRLRVEAADARDELKERVEAFNLKNAQLIDVEAKAHDAVQEAEDEIRALAVTAYEADPSSKDLGAGVTIAVRTTYEYDPELALNWAKEKAPIMVSEVLDRTAFNNFVKVATIACPAFVTVKTDPQARIAQDLGAALEKDGA
jgi:hypothetical protein